MALDGIRADAVFHLDLPGGWLDDATLALLVQEHHEFEAVLGVPVIFSTPSDGCPRWIAEAGGFDEPPSLTWDWDTLTLISRAGDHDGLMATFSLLQTLAHTRERSVRAAPAVTVADAVERVHHECATTYPYFGLRDLDWDVMWQAACGGRPRRWQELVPWASRLVAGLGDAHTAVLEKDAPGFSPLYTADLRGDGAHLVDVPRRSAAYAAGVRAGWVVCMDNPSRWFATVGASPQQHGRMAARRAMRISGDQRTFTALDPRTRREASWVETATPPGLEDLVSVRRNPSGAVLVTLRAFDSRQDIESVLDDLTVRATPMSHMVLDLRGNVGGDLMLATRLRDRFLRSRTTLGSIAFTDGRGGLSERSTRWSEPASRGRWPGRLTVATDASTYSAAEDFLLGLQGLEHVTVVGERTGGGSGRPRTVPLASGCDLRISTAVTYDRSGFPVEFRGIHPDRPLRRPLELL